MEKQELLRKQIIELIGQYAQISFNKAPFIQGETPVPASGKCIGSKELQFMTDAVLDGWLTTGRFNEEFEKELASFIGVNYVSTTNSGSSANLLALSALTSPKLGDKRLKPGDEVITVAAGFPTTVNPILINNLVPVFLDVDIPTYNIDTTMLEEALSEKTRAVMIAHTLGNPFNLLAIKDFVKKHNLWLIEDCCDALGSEYNGQKVGTFGHIGTVSFYPAHHITMGEGGAVFTNVGKYNKIIESFRDWGRDCYCDPGNENTCGKRFNWQLGNLPKGYDHKYTYSHLGYNLKITDMQAAAGLAQLQRLTGFIDSRKKNFNFLNKRLKPLSDFLVLPVATENSDPSWFGFPITIRSHIDKSRVDLQQHLDSSKIGSRLLFSGNITKQPYFSGRKYRIIGDLSNTDTIMNMTFWVGIFPGLTEEMLEFTANRIAVFFGVDL